MCARLPTDIDLDDLDEHDINALRGVYMSPSGGEEDEMFDYVCTVCGNRAEFPYDETRIWERCLDEETCNGRDRFHERIDP